MAWTLISTYHEEKIPFYSYLHHFPGADPGFPVGGGANPPGGRQPSRGAPTYDFAKYSEKLHEIEKIRHCIHLSMHIGIIFHGIIHLIQRNSVSCQHKSFLKFMSCHITSPLLFYMRRYHRLFKEIVHVFDI